MVISLVSFGLFGPALSTTNINIVKWRYFVIFSPVFFLFLELGIFLFKFGKKHTFWHWEHDRISVVKTGKKNPGYKELQKHQTPHAFLRTSACVCRMSENCKSLVLRGECNIEIFLSPALQTVPAVQKIPHHTDVLINKKYIFVNSNTCTF